MNFPSFLQHLFPFIKKQSPTKFLLIPPSLNFSSKQDTFKESNSQIRDFLMRFSALPKKTTPFLNPSSCKSENGWSQRCEQFCGRARPGRQVDDGNRYMKAGRRLSWFCLCISLCTQATGIACGKIHMCMVPLDGLLLPEALRRTLLLSFFEEATKHPPIYREIAKMPMYKAKNSYFVHRQTLFGV